VARSRVAILICAYNEEKTIKKIVNEAKKLGEVFIIDDGSTDDTRKNIKYQKINYFRNRKNIGYEKSLLKGFKIILTKKYDFLVTMDADGQHKINSVKSALLKIKNFDVVVGSRYTHNNLLEKILSYFTKKYLELNDILCGMKVYRLSKYKNYYDKNLDIIGTSLLFYGIKLNLKISEIKINCNLRKHGTSRYYSNLKNYFKIFKLIKKTIQS